MTTAYSNRDNNIRWQIEIDGKLPDDGFITRVVLQVGDVVIDSETSDAIEVSSSGVVTARLSGLGLAEGPYTAWLTAYTLNGEALAIERPRITMRIWRPDLA